MEELEREVLALVAERHDHRIKINWQFSLEKGRDRFSRHYGEMNPANKTIECSQI